MSLWGEVAEPLVGVKPITYSAAIIQSVLCEDKGFKHRVHVKTIHKDDTPARNQVRIDRRVAKIATKIGDETVREENPLR